MDVPTVRIKPFVIKPLDLTSLSPEMGVNIPSSGGLFPWQPASFAASQWPSWGPAENLAPSPALAQEREARRQRERAFSLLQHLMALPADATLEKPQLDELRSAGIPTATHTTPDAILKSLRGPDITRKTIDSFDENKKALLKAQRPDVWAWYLGAGDGDYGEIGVAGVQRLVPRRGGWRRGNWGSDGTMKGYPAVRGTARSGCGELMELLTHMRNDTIRRLVLAAHGVFTRRNARLQECITAGDTAKLIGLSRTAVLKAIASGRLPAERGTGSGLGGRLLWLIRLDHVLVYRVDQQARSAGMKAGRPTRSVSRQRETL